MTDIVCVWCKQDSQKPHVPVGETRDWTVWGPTYVRRLRAGVQRFSGQEVICITNDPSIPEPTLPHVGPGRGWWAKMDVFNPQHRLTDVLYLDLDNVVCGALAPLLDLSPQPLIMADDKIYPRLPNGSTYRAQVDQLTYLWDDYLAHHLAIEHAFSTWPHGADQGYLSAMVEQRTGQPVPLFPDFLPPQTLLFARSELEAGVAPSPETCVVYGSWRPKPHESQHPFYRQYWFEPLSTHADAV